MTKFSLEHTEGQPVLSCPVANLYETAHQMSGSRTDDRLMGQYKNRVTRVIEGKAS